MQGQNVNGENFGAGDYTRGTQLSSGVSAISPKIELKQNESLTLWRGTVPTNHKLAVLSASIVDKDGNRHNHLEVEVYNHTTDTTEYVSDEAIVQRNGPLFEGCEGDDVEIRVVNATTTAKVINPQLGFNIIKV